MSELHTGGAIPSRIIQTGRNLDGLSEEEQRWRDLIFTSNPHFEILFFDDEAVSDFMRDEWPDFLTLQERFESRIQRFDLFRYLAVYSLGGFYFDLDMEITQSLEPLLSSEAVFPFEKLTIFPWLRNQGMTWQLGNYAFGAAAGHPFLEEVINLIRSWLDDPRTRGIPWWYPPDVKSMMRVYYSTGPGAVSRAYLRRPDLRDRIEVLCPDAVHVEQQFGSYGVHRCYGSWKAGNPTLTTRLLGFLNGRAHSANKGRSPKDIVARSR